FAGFRANNDIDFSVRWGQVHALLGENGAGKTTLCSVAAGVHSPDAGQIVVDGSVRRFRSPRDAIGQGIGMVYQHFRLVKTFSVAENLVLGSPRASFLLRKQGAEGLKQLTAQFELAVDPERYVWQLSAGEQQRVEILRLLLRGADILLLDEPTALLT